MIGLLAITVLALVTTASAVDSHEIIEVYGDKGGKDCYKVIARDVTLVRESGPIFTLVATQRGVRTHPVISVHTSVYV